MIVGLTFSKIIIELINVCFTSELKNFVKYCVVLAKHSVIWFQFDLLFQHYSWFFYIPSYYSQNYAGILASPLLSSVKYTIIIINIIPYSTKFWQGKFWCFWCFPTRPSKFNPLNCLKTTTFTGVWWKTVTIHQNIFHQIFEESVSIKISPIRILRYMVL